jgi:hypothetical protein
VSRIPKTIPFLAIAAAAAILSVAAIVPAAAGAATIGSRHVPTSSSGGVFCGGFDSCALAQTTLPGAITRAPFDGTLKSWKVNVDTAGGIQLVVLRKHSDGSFKAVGQSGVKSAPDGLSRFAAKLKLRKGDFIGLNLLDGDVTIFSFPSAQQGFTDFFMPSFDLGTRQLPYAPFSGVGDELQLSAKLSR